MAGGLPAAGEAATKARVDFFPGGSGFGGVLAEAEDEDGRAGGEVAGQRDGVAVECGAGGGGNGGS